MGCMNQQPLWSPSGSILILQSLSSRPLSLKLKCWQSPANFCADVCRPVFSEAVSRYWMREWKIQKFNSVRGVEAAVVPRWSFPELLCSLTGSSTVTTQTFVLLSCKEHFDRINSYRQLSLHLFYHLRGDLVFNPSPGLSYLLTATWVPVWRSNRLVELHVPPVPRRIRSP